MIPSITQLQHIFGNIDIYLFDQLLKGRIQHGMKVLDAGCGAGRNVEYLLKAGIEVYGADASPEAIEQVRNLALQLVSNVPPQERFILADLAELPFDDSSFHAVLCSAVLHFATDEAHFREMLQEQWRVLKPGGIFFCRLSTTIGVEGKLQALGKRQYQMPHGPVWFLADECLLREMIHVLGAEMQEPLKTVLVEQARSMTTLVLRKK